jgi:hypothetical protein
MQDYFLLDALSLDYAEIGNAPELQIKGYRRGDQ